MTCALLAAMLALWVAAVGLTGRESLASWLALAPSHEAMSVLIALGARENRLIHDGQYWRLIMPLFLHAGIVHLAFNSFSLFMLGSAVERIYGSARFFIMFLFSGICGSVVSYEFSPGIGVGASGAIFGLAGVIIVFAVRYRQSIPPRFIQEVRTVLVPLVLLQLVLGFAWPALDANAHLGGFLGGCLLAGLAEWPRLGRIALERERLPVELALATAVLLTGYTGVSAAANVRRELPALRADAAPAVRLGPTIRSLRDLVRRQPDRLESRLDYLNALCKAGLWAEAAEQCREILERDPRQARVRILLWLSLRELGRPTKAEQALQELMSHLPKERGARFEIATLLYSAGQAKEAAEIYREILREDPNNPAVLNNLAYLYCDSLNAHHAEAVALARRAVALRPRDGTFWETLGWALYRHGRLTEAIEAQERACELDRSHPETRYHLGVMYEAQGRRADAEREYRAALQRDPAYAPARSALLRKLNGGQRAPADPPTPPELRKN